MFLPIAFAIDYNTSIVGNNAVLYWNYLGYSGDVWYNNQTELDNSLAQQLIELEFSVNKTINEVTNETIDGSLVIKGDVHINGTLYGSSPLKIGSELEFTDYLYDGLSKLKQILNRIRDVLIDYNQRINSVENKIQQIEDNGYTGTCPDGTKPEFNQGIMVRCT